MIKQSIVVCSILASFTSVGQTVVSTQGDSYETATGSVSFTIGEVVIDTGTDGSTNLTQGFHQTNWNFIGLDDHDVDYVANIYPNPTSDILNVEVIKFENVSYAMYDATGRIVAMGDLSDLITQIDVQNLESGSYQLELSDEQNERLKTFKLIKNY
ncbi:MAG: T9SS type A sorting domain-containing protein [Flavobacteriales bacterium]|nr:T9SS type A sorting domain-containing protein [Flavobacteriales bacterium]